MFDRLYRERLEADLLRWQADGVITPAASASIRNALPPLASHTNIPAVVGIVGGLLIAAALLAFVAAHWIEIARLLRLAILFAGIFAAYGLGAWFARTERQVLADLCASVGSITSLRIRRSTSGVTTGAGEYAPMPPVFGPRSPSSRRLWSWLVAIGTKFAPSLMTM